MSEKTRVVLAVVLSLAVLVSWEFIRGPAKDVSVESKVAISDNSNIPPESQARVPGEHRNVPGKSVMPAMPKDREHAIEMTSASRLTFTSPKLSGSVWLKGLKIDDATLSGYKDSQDADAKDVILLSPHAGKAPYFVDFSWVVLNKGVPMPDDSSLWISDKPHIGPGDTAHMHWDNEHGVMFNVELSIDDAFMLNVRQYVINNSGHDLQMEQQARIFRHVQESKGGYVATEGLSGVSGKKLFEYEYSKLRKLGVVSLKNFDLDIKGFNRWFALTDKYWLVSVIPIGDAPMSLRVSSKHDVVEGVSYHNNIVGNGERAESSYHIYVGAKEIDALDKYESKYKIFNFDRAVDFGILYFISRPMLLMLLFFHRLVGNFGIAIMLLTIVVRLAMFFVTYRSYDSTQKMRQIQPQLQEIRSKLGNNKEAVHRETMILFQKHKINPMSGCLPLLLQIPVFFALYKVLYISLDMRHAAFCWWIKDLSAPDPVNIFNALRFIGIDLPPVFNVGISPLIFGATMALQQKIQGSAMPDPNQATAMKFLPYVFVLMFASFPSGLILYWSWNNILSIVQHVVMVRLHKDK